MHGHADKLEGLLRKMGYVPHGRGYRPPVGRQLIFLGDLIDRGPQQLRVLEIARSMMDEGDARAVMGNHEFNAIGYVTRRVRISAIVTGHFGIVTGASGIVTGEAHWGGLRGLQYRFSVH